MVLNVSALHLLGIAGLLYTAMPRGDMVGTATFIDKGNQLYGEVAFGKVPGKEDDPLLQRTDAVRTEIYQLATSEPARVAHSEPNTASTSHVRSSLLYQ